MDWETEHLWTGELYKIRLGNKTPEKFEKFYTGPQIISSEQW